MSDVISSRMADALDVAVERMLAVMLKWAEDHRGPSNNWTQPIAETVEILARSRVALAKLAELTVTPASLGDSS